MLFVRPRNCHVATGILGALNRVGAIPAGVVVEGDTPMHQAVIAAFDNDFGACRCHHGKQAVAIYESQ
jgi:hypothetical protein